jgi:hypothetical protein
MNRRNNVTAKENKTQEGQKSITLDIDVRLASTTLLPLTM